MKNNDLIFEAIKFVAEAHANHYRKGTNIPYISHLMNVMKILCKYNCETKVIVAGILHDVVEDTKVTIEEVEQKFGKDIAEIVAGASEREKILKNNHWKASWKERKQNTIEFLKRTDKLEKLLVSCADKLDNARDILADYQELGNDLWTRFNAGKDEQMWYYQSLVKVFLQRGEEFGDPLLKMAKDLEQTVKSIFQTS